MVHRLKNSTKRLCEYRTLCQRLLCIRTWALHTLFSSDPTETSCSSGNFSKETRSLHWRAQTRDAQLKLSQNTKSFIKLFTLEIQRLHEKLTVSLLGWVRPSVWNSFKRRVIFYLPSLFVVVGTLARKNVNFGAANEERYQVWRRGDSQLWRLESTWDFKFS